MKIHSLEHRQRKVVAEPPRRGVRVALQGLRKSYPGRQVLSAVNFEVQAGEFIAVVGRSGCGKSTLLRLIAGLEAADDGQIAFGRDDGSSHKPDTRVMFQDARLLPWKRVLDNVALGLRNSSACASDALQKVRLLERARDWPAVLSGGQRQRVALARALVHDPELLLLDEPLGALDALTRIEMQQLIESLWQQRGFTALLVTHDVQEAIVLADRVILIEDGRITLDERIALPRPRARGNPVFAQIEERILARVLRSPAGEPGADISALKTVNQVTWAT
jgi:sulfonate transport system ATP-binding protein